MHKTSRCTVEVGNEKNRTNPHLNRGKSKHQVIPYRQPMELVDKENVQPEHENVSPSV